MNIAGMSLNGGRKENFFFCLLEHHVESDRWYMKSLHQVKDEVERDGNLATLSWIESYHLKGLVIDFPLGNPPCLTCTLPCPGIDQCIHPDVQRARSRIHELMHEDRSRREGNPKRYEQEREQDNAFDHLRDVTAKRSSEHLLSKSFKRRLKKGLLPYWNRPLDLWIWEHYYDPMLNVFNLSYDSFGTVSLMLMNRLHYLRKHFPPSLTLYESVPSLCLIECLQAKVIGRRELSELTAFDPSIVIEARQRLLQSIEKRLKVFIYDQDASMLVRDGRAFDSFLLAVSGTCFVQGKARPIPAWAQPGATHFIAPTF